MTGIEPANAGTKPSAVTTWRHPPLFKLYPKYKEFERSNN